MYLVIYTLCITPGVSCPPPREGHSLCQPNSLVLGLKAMATHTCTKLCNFCWHCLYTCMSSDWYFILLFWGFLHWWHHGNTPVTLSRVGVPCHMVISFGTNSNSLLFIWFSPYSETFFCFFPYMYWFSIGWTSKIKYFKTIVQYHLITYRNWQIIIRFTYWVIDLTLFLTLHLALFLHYCTYIYI